MGDNVAEDLWPERLSRLPVKSLLRFRCVSKSWKSLIADPGFRQSHFNSFKNNCRQTHLLFEQLGASSVDYVVRCSDTLESIAVLGTTHYRNNRGITTLHTSDYPGTWVIKGYVNGLCLLKAYRSGEESMLWNPSIRKFRRIPPPPKICSDISSIDLGLGFDPLNEDYKLVRLVGPRNKDGVVSVAVYSIMTGSWKVLHFPGKQWSGWRWPGPPYKHLYKLVCFQGYMCFSAESVDDGSALLVSFDLRREVFASILMPKSWSNEILRVANGECLWVKCDYKTGNVGSIWVLEGCGGVFESMCWKQRRSFSIEAPTWPLHVLNNGDMLLRVTLCDKKVLIRFNVETLEKIILEAENRFDLLSGYEYNESLILLE